MSNTGYLKLIRVANTQDGMFGVLKLNEIPFCVTLEPKDLANKRNVSCIPTGQYVCEKYGSTKYGKTWEVTKVPDRSYILIHSGNTMNHTQGCILLAQHYGKLFGDLAVLNSGKTFERFLDIAESYVQMILTITEAF